MIQNFTISKKNLAIIPPEIQEFLGGWETIGKLNVICKDFELGDKENQLADIVVAVARGEINLYDIPSEIENKLKIEFSKALDIDAELYDKLFSDIEDVIEAQYAAHEGFSPPPAPAPVIKESDIGEAEEKKRAEQSLIEKAIKKFNLFPGDEAAAKKFIEIASTFLNSARTKSQFKNTLIKSVSDGGLAMAHDLADNVTEFLASYMRIQDIETKKQKNIETKPVLPKFSPSEKGDKGGFINPPSPRSELRSTTGAQPSFSHSAVSSWSNDKGGSIRPVPPNVKVEVTFEKEEKEAAKQKSKIEKIKMQAPKLLSVTEGVTKALAELNYTFPSSELQERLKSVIDSRVRNVRTSVQTFEKLTQDIGSGGMGFTKEEADKISLVLNKYLEEKNKDIYDGKLSEIKQAEDEEKRKNEERARAAEETERKNLDERFTKMTGKKAELPHPPSPLKGEEPPAVSSSIRTVPLLSKEGLGEVKKSSIVNQKSEIPSPHPVLEDIKFIPKLVGPLEEIGQFTLDDFRKLSHDPKEAILKIKDKLELLRGESYKKYQLGIEAWQKSPLYGEYLKVMSQGLATGASLEEAIKSSQTLTKDEFDAIIESKIE